MGSGQTLHFFRGIATTDVKNFINGINQMLGSTKDLRKAWVEAGKAVDVAATRIIGSLTAMGVGVSKVFMDFEAQMVEVGAISRTLGTKDFANLEAAAKRMGETTQYTATEAAGALKELALAGLTANQAIAALPPTLQLAAAAGLSIGQAAGISAKIMKAFGLEAEQLARVNDVLVSTFTRANTDLTMLAEGLKHVAPLANTLGVSIEDTTAVLAKFADAGFQGEMGGTALRNILSRLSGAFPRAIGDLSRVGITTLDTTGKMRPFLDILQEIEDAGLSAGEVMRIFGQRGGPQLLALLEVGVAEVRKFSEETQKMSGVTARMQEARMKTMKGQWEELTSIIEGVILQIGSELAPYITRLIDDTEKWIGENKTEIVQVFVTALKSLTAAFKDAIQWLRENRKRLLEVAQAIATVLEWVIDFMARYPEFMAALAAFKVAGLLGITNAAVALGKALYAVLTYLSAMVARYVAVATAAKAAAVAQAAAAVAGGAGAAAAAGGAAVGVIAPVAAAAGGAAVATKGGAIMAWLRSAIPNFISWGAAFGTMVAGMKIKLAAFGAAISAFAAPVAKATAAIAVLGVAIWGLWDIAKSFITIARKEQANKRMQEVQNQGREDEFERIIQAVVDKRQQETVDRGGEDPGPRFTIEKLGELLKQQAKNIQDVNDQVDLAKEQGKSTENLEVNIGKLESNVKRINQEISKQGEDLLNSVMGGMNDDQIRKDLKTKFNEINEQFKAGVINVDQFAKSISGLSERMKALNEDKNDSPKFSTVRLARRRMTEGKDLDGNDLTGGISENVDFAQFDKTFGVLKQLQNVDKAWAEKFAEQMGLMVASVEEMRRNKMNQTKTIEAEKELGRKLQELEKEAHNAVSATITKSLSRQQKEQRLQARKDNTEGFEDFSAQIETVTNNAGGITENGLKNIGADAIAQLAMGIEGATPELRAEFVAKFLELKDRGAQAFGEGIDDLVLTFLERANEFKERVKEIEESVKEETNALQEQQRNLLEDGNATKDAIGLIENQGDRESVMFAFEKLKQDMDREIQRRKQLEEDFRAGRINADQLQEMSDAGPSQKDFAKREGNIGVAAAGVQQAENSIKAIFENLKQQIAALEGFSQKGKDEFEKNFKQGFEQAQKDYEAKVESLKNELLNGTISADNFNKKMAELGQQLDESAAKANEAALAIQREQIMKGDFSSLDPQKALQDRLFNFQMSKWNQWIDGLFNQMMGLGNATQGITQGFDRLGDQMQAFGNGMVNWIEGPQGGGGFGGGGGMPDIAGGLAALNSKQGIIAQLTNEIAGLSQVFTLPNVSADRKREIAAQIDKIQARINELSYVPPPTFIGTSTDPLFNDPGLQGGNSSSTTGQGGAGRGGNLSVAMSFPNVNKLNNTDIGQVYDMLEREARRRGLRFQPGY